MGEYFPISEKIGTKSQPEYSYKLYSYKKKKECNVHKVTFWKKSLELKVANLDIILIEK